MSQMQQCDCVCVRACVHAWRYVRDNDVHISIHKRFERAGNEHEELVTVVLMVFGAVHFILNNDYVSYVVYAILRAPRRPDWHPRKRRRFGVVACFFSSCVNDINDHTFPREWKTIRCTLSFASQTEQCETNASEI